MRARIVGVVVGTGLTALLASAPARAHHAIGAVVDSSRKVESMMVLTKVDWINPHIWLHFTLTKPDGVIVNDVAVEWMGVSALRQSGYADAGAFPLGRAYDVTYYPNRDGSPGGHVFAISMMGLSSEGTGGGGAAAPPPPKPTLRPALPNTSY
jgi:hypothetical protein